MAEETPEFHSGDAIYLIELGTQVRFDLNTPCASITNGLRCMATEGYIEVIPFQSSYHYKQSCSNGHYVRHVRRPEVELVLGIIPRSETDSKAVRDILSPSRRIGLNVILRDNNACVYCGRRVGEQGLDGKPVVVSADHIIPKYLINPDDIRRDGDLLLFAREIQLVTACQSCNSAKQRALLPLEIARETFIRHVLKNVTRGKNLGHVSTFERLYHLAERNERLRNKRPPTW